MKNIRCVDCQRCRHSFCGLFILYINNEYKTIRCKGFLGLEEK